MMESSFQDKYKKKQVPGNYQKKRLDRTYQIASSAFDSFSSQDNALQKYIQSEAEENKEIEMEITSLLFKSHYFDLNDRTPRSQVKQSSAKKSLSMTPKTLSKTQNNNQLPPTSLYKFFKEYTSSFMNKPENTKSDELKYSSTLPKY